MFNRRQVAALGLTLALGSVPAIGAEPGSQPLASDSPVELFSVEGTSSAEAMRAGRGGLGREAIRLNRAIVNLPLQAKARFSLPRGVTYELIYDNRQDHPSGNVTFSGYLRDYGDDYRAIITFGDKGVSGRILTPDGEFLIESDADGEWLVDTQAAGLNPMEMGHDTVIPVPRESQKPAPQRGREGSAPTDAGPGKSSEAVPTADAASTVIDAMILYTPGLANQLGNGLSARLDQLVALSNQAYRDSGVAINLRLVHSQQVDYGDATSNLDALKALTNGSDPGLAHVANLRNTHGADLVSLVRPFHYSTAGSCGVAWVGGAGGQPISGYADYGYSVISDGRDSGYYCLDLTLAHELGHNMGSMHDRAHSDGQQGAYPYSHGHGVEGVFGTVMSYINPRVGKFSNPAVTCANGAACGVSETAADAANNALSLNNTRQAVASFRNATSTATYSLTIKKSGDGGVSSNPVGIDCGASCSYRFAEGTQVTLSATPLNGYTFAGWGGDCAGMDACTVTLSSAKNVTATFVSAATAKYTLTVAKSKMGTVRSGPVGIDCGATCSAEFPTGTFVALSATPIDSRYVFTGWKGACTGTGACTVTMDAAKKVKAIFKKQRN